MVYWVFGYGSLIFKPPPHAVEHKAPGRVVTVIEAREWHMLEGITVSEGAISSDDYVWGMAYRIDPQYEDEVKTYMEYREKNGYTCHFVPVYNASPDGLEEIAVVDNAEIWIGKLDNPAFIGYESLDNLARIISERSGPSGLNKEYLYKLAESVRQLYPHVRDEYLFGLEAAVRALEEDDY
ncbi:uncharacterized protein IL334_002243 [Kwoniella shivajii]|uniref:glutathione-specific gamma-glutamylcyclotransferase n=1 Tax=Kwoniella shivajii TaxID=564305 RepID=A0ABZ1CVT6_9TREE|nr:hypothetical protein IL334_002243 [Kwoniella shivajii]